MWKPVSARTRTRAVSAKERRQRQARARAGSARGWPSSSMRTTVDGFPDKNVASPRHTMVLVYVSGRRYHMGCVVHAGGDNVLVFPGEDVGDRAVVVGGPSILGRSLVVRLTQRLLGVTLFISCSTSRVQGGGNRGGSTIHSRAWGASG